MEPAAYPCPGRPGRIVCLTLKLKLFVWLLALSVIALAVGGWTVKGVRRALHVPALALVAIRPLRAGAEA